MVWLRTFARGACPATGETPSDALIGSSQAPSSARPSVTATTLFAHMTVLGDVCVRLHEMAERALDAPLAHPAPKLLPRDLRLAVEEELALGGEHRRLERRGEVASGRDRTAQPRGDDDDEVGFVLLERGGAEQRAEDGHVADPWHLILSPQVVALQQAGDGEALAVAEFDRRARPAGGEAGELHEPGVEGGGEVDLADLRLQREVDEAVAEHDGREAEPNAEFLVFDRNFSVALGHRDRHLAAGEKARRLSRERRKRGFGEIAGQPAFLQRLYQQVHLGSAGDQVGDEAAEGLPGSKLWSAGVYRGAVAIVG